MSTGTADDGDSRGLHVLRPPTNLADRILITIRDPPLDTDFGNGNNKVVKTISALCLNNWPEPKITWASTTDVHKRFVWQEFQRYYRWDPAQGDKIYKLFCAKAKERTKDNLKNVRDKARRKAAEDNSDIRAHKPKWCSHAVWVGMCDLWDDEAWQKKRAVASKNRASGADEAPPTWRGGSITQMQHYATQESASEGQRVDWLDLYVATHRDTPAVDEIADNYKTAFDAKYSSGASRPDFDLELWERASVVKKNYVKGFGQRRKYSETCSSSSSASTQSSQACSHPPTHSAADCLQAVLSDPTLLAQFSYQLSQLTPEQLAAGAAAAEAEKAAARAAAEAEAAAQAEAEGTQNLD